MNPLLDQLARQVVQTFAGCLLVPVRPGIAPESVPPPFANEANSDTFRARFATDSIAVVLGGRSGGLFAIQFEDEAVMAGFLARNPVIRATLVTMHGGLPLVWLRARTAHRVGLCLPNMNVLMRGHLLVVNRSGLERSDVILNQAAPLMVNPESLHWGSDPDGRIDSWLTRLNQGDFFRRNTQGRVFPNRRAWRHYLTRRLRPCFAYEPNEGHFFERIEARDWRPVPEDQLRLRLQELIAMAPVDAPEAKARLSDEWLGQICRGLKASLAVHLPIVETRLHVFAAACLGKKPGANMTNLELTAAFTAYCQQTGQPQLSGKKFKVLIGRVLRGEPWGLCCSKSIKRLGGHQNGWRGLVLKDATMTPTIDGGADGADGVAI